MFLLFIVSLKIWCVISIPSGNSTTQKIIVAVEQRKPFSIVNENGTLSGLGVQIIDQFARKLNLAVDYLVINSSKSSDSKTFSAQVNLR